MSSAWIEEELQRILAKRGLDSELVSALLQIIEQGVSDDPPTLTDGIPSETVDFSPEPTWTDLHRKDRIPPGPSPPASFGRYEMMKRIGQGGMGEVFRVRDRDLNRKMVLKVIRRIRVTDQEAVLRFIEEAQITAQLQHPGIVPVHELGKLADGRVYFTMKEVRGRTLSDVIEEAHQRFAESDEADRVWETSFRPLIGMFQRACEPVAFAHSKKVIHRDLKPDNIMVGDYGEVQIIDWGLAKLLETTSEYGGDIPRGLASLGEETSSVTTDRGDSQSFDTNIGSIVGTPAFMSPEQARGELDALTATTDVYSLGVILFVLLDGALPFTGKSPAAVIFQVIEGKLRTPGLGVDAPEELQQICLKAMAMNPGDRFSTAAELANAIAAWRDGAHRRDRARSFLQEAIKHIPEAHDLKLRAAALHAQSDALLDALSPNSSMREKQRAWEMQDEATFLTREARARRGHLIRLMYTALSYVPNLPEAHERLADIYHAEHVQAEENRDHDEIAMVEVNLKAHDRGKYHDYLIGNGRLTLVTDPPQAQIEIFRYAQSCRRLEPALGRILGRAPIHEAELPMGSYLLSIRAPGRATVTYPVLGNRLGHWDCVPPGRDSPLPVYLPLREELGPGDIYVPAGWCRTGGDPLAHRSHQRQQKWVDGFVIKRHPVTNAEYLDFLNAIGEEQGSDRALAYLPRDVGSSTPLETPIYTLGESGKFVIPSEQPECGQWPVQFIDWHSATAYAQWRAQVTGLPWRLPLEDEWEKAARGVDGRFFPWGDFLDPTWCRMIHSTSSIPQPAPIGEYTQDESPYGVRGMAGNMRDWCADVFEVDDDSSMRVFRGGAWFSQSDLCRVASRTLKPPETRSAGTGLRLVRSLGAVTSELG